MEFSDVNRHEVLHAIRDMVDASSFSEKENVSFVYQEHEFTIQKVQKVPTRNAVTFDEVNHRFWGVERICPHCQQQVTDKRIRCRFFDASEGRVKLETFLNNVYDEHVQFKQAKISFQTLLVHPPVFEDPGYRCPFQLTYSINGIAKTVHLDNYLTFPNEDPSHLSEWQTDVWELFSNEFVYHKDFEEEMVERVYEQLDYLEQQVIIPREINELRAFQKRKIDVSSSSYDKDCDTVFIYFTYEGKETEFIAMMPLDKTYAENEIYKVGEYWDYRGFSCACAKEYFFDYFETVIDKVPEARIPYLYVDKKPQCSLYDRIKERKDDKTCVKKISNDWIFEMYHKQS